MDQEPDEGSPANPPPDRGREWQAPSGSEPGAGQQGPPQYQPPSYPPPQHQPPQYQPPQYQPPQYQPPQYQPPQYGQSVRTASAATGIRPAGYGPQPGYGAGGWSAPFAEKPGVIPLRPLAVGEILDGVFTTIRQNPKTLLGLSFVIVLVGQLGVLGLTCGLTARAMVSGSRGRRGHDVITLLLGHHDRRVVIVIGEAVLGTRISPATRPPAARADLAAGGLVLLAG